LEAETKGKVIPIRIEDEMKQSYIDYAMSVIVNRALPDVRDGLKPVHRRILYAMRDLGLQPNRPHKKSARAVGEVLGKYHPHGESLYDTMVRLAQDFAIRHTLVDGHGNFGSIDGDPPAAMRYTEVRMTQLATEMLRDIEKETVDFSPNFDETLQEPTVLPSRFPNLLVNGSSGIAVGLSTNIPPHNLGEVIDGVLLLADNPDVGVKRLMRVIKGPDFPTGGLILGRGAIRSCYEKGRGRIRMRARTEIQEDDNGKSRIIVHEIPYQVNKSSLIEKIAELARDKKIQGITDLRDESDRRGLRIVIEVSRGANANVLLNRLFKYTQLQQTFGAIMIALVDGEPRTLTLKQMLHYYLEHQKEIIIRRTQYDLRKAEDRAHILEGLRIALANLDAIIALIRASDDADEARAGLMANFGLSEKQAQAILDMRLQRLTGLERDKIEVEYKELQEKIAHYRAILGSEQMVLDIVKDELGEIKEKYADERRTDITAPVDALEIEDLISEEDIVITITHEGYVKRVPADAYKTQRRGGKGIIATSTKETDFVEHVYTTTTHHFVLFFTNMGKVYCVKGYQIPQAGRHARGSAVINIIPIEHDEVITAVIPVKDFDSKDFLIMATAEGKVKKTALPDYSYVKYTGINAITLREGDELVSVRLTPAEEDKDIFLVTRKGMSIRFNESEVRPMGRTAQGVKGINLSDADRVVGMDVYYPGAHLLLVTAKGYGKRTPVEEYRGQSRGGKGLKTANMTDRIGDIVGFKVVDDDAEVILLSQEGSIIRIPVAGVSVQSRYSQGVTLMRFDQGDRIVSLAQVANGGDEEIDHENGVEGETHGEQDSGSEEDL